MKEIRFSKQALERVPLPAEGTRATYSDSEARGLSLRVTDSGIKTFQVYRKIDGKPVRVALGRFPTMTVEHARKRAALVLAQLTEGRNPNAERKAEQRRSITLGQVLEDYIAARKSLKPSTAQGYSKLLRELFCDWSDKPITAISRDMVSQRHNTIGARSPAQANKGARVLSLLFNFAAGAYEDADGKPILTDNPVKRISHTRAWYPVERRRGVLEPHQIKPWWEAVEALEARSVQDSAETVRDYLRFLVLTGLRREEAAQLRWDHVSVPARKIVIPDTKNREPHALPLSDYLVEMLDRRRCAAFNGYVFGSASSKRGHLVNPTKVMLRVETACGFRFMLHDLRRTFLTAAERLDIPVYALKRLANHMTGDITASYIVMDVERLREPMQKITDYFLRAAGHKPSAEVVELRPSGQRA